MIPRTAPVVLASDVITLPAAATPSMAVSAPHGLRNNDDVGVLIDQLNFSSGLPGPPAVVGVSLRYKGEPLTNGWVPQVGICPVTNDRFDDYAIGFLTVRLAKPIYLGPGEWIDVSATLPYKGYGAPFSFQAFAQGRFADAPAPNDRWLPYFATYNGVGQDGSTNAVFSMVSTPQDLGNPFPDRSVIIDRLIGRVVAGATGVLGPFYASTPSVQWPAFKMRISDDQARWWVPTPTPIHAATNVLTRAWRLNYALPPQSFLRVEIEGTATFAVAPNNFTYALPIIGMVGYRRIG